jgi:hypothetical protein
MGMQKSLKNVYCICLVFSLVLFMSLEMMFIMTIVLSKIQYTKSLFQVLVGSIGMLRQGGIGLLAIV